MIPKDVPRQSREALNRIIQDCKDEKAKKWPIVVISIRGFFRDSLGKPRKNDRNLYDDGFIIVTEKGLYSYNGNNDPSVYEEDIAKLVPGVHWYKRGIHGVSKPKDQQYLAWVPATPGKKLPVIRDGQSKVTMGIACNIHRGGNATTSSAGCQTVPPSQWPAFDKKLEGLMKELKVDKYPCILIEKPDL